MSKQVEIKNNRPRIYSANGVSLNPGLNRLSEAEAEKFLAHPHIQIKVDRGLIELRKGAKLPANAATATEPQGGSDEDNGGEPNPFAELDYFIGEKNANDSMATIKDIEDKEYLEYIVATEERTTVKAAAEKRLAELAEEGGQE